MGQAKPQGLTLGKPKEDRRASGHTAELQGLITRAPRSQLFFGRFFNLGGGFETWVSLGKSGACRVDLPGFVHLGCWTSLRGVGRVAPRVLGLCNIDRTS